MFDKHLHVWGGDQHHHHRTDIHEHRAPTDKSVELLKEMEEKALQRLLSSVRLDGCQVSCVVHQMRDQMGLGDMHFIVRYRLGAKESEVRHTFRAGWGDKHDERQRMVRELVETVAEDIAVQILGEPMEKATRGLSW